MKIRASTLAIAMTLMALLSVACGEALQSERMVFMTSDVAFNDFALGNAYNYEIYVMNPDGSAITQLTKHGAFDGQPALSPDGQRIAFVTYRDGNNEIYAMDSDGSDMTRLTHHDADDSEPVWSPDGRRIVFISERDGNKEIYAMNADGSDITRLTNHDAHDLEPAWSPDGQRIAFVSTRNSDQDGNHAVNAEIYAVNADGSETTRLTNHSAYDYQPAWSPDGQRIAFVSDRDAEQFYIVAMTEIYSMNADGSDLIRLTNNDKADRNPVWSPDGQRIAFSASRGHGHSSIYVMNADGSETIQFFRGSSPVWSPDGRRIAFTDYPGDGDIIGGDSEIYVMSVDWDELMRVADSNVEFLVIDVDGVKVTQITDNDVRDGLWAWESAD